MPPSPMPPTTVYFATGSSTLSPEAMSSIQQVAANYKTMGNATVTLTGHTDTVGSPDVNMTLSQRRAAAVRNALVRDITVVGQTMARTGMTDAEYCAKLSTTYRDYRTSQADEEAAAAMAQCQAGNTAAGIPVLERTLTTAKIPLPSRY